MSLQDKALDKNSAELSAINRPVSTERIGILDTDRNGPLRVKIGCNSARLDLMVRLQYLKGDRYDIARL